MAKIQVDVATYEMPKSNCGRFMVSISGGLNEDPEKILAEALERLKASLAALPEEKRYPQESTPLFIPGDI